MDFFYDVQVCKQRFRLVDKGKFVLDEKDFVRVDGVFGRIEGNEGIEVFGYKFVGNEEGCRERLACWMKEMEKVYGKVERRVYEYTGKRFHLVLCFEGFSLNRSEFWIGELGIKKIYKSVLKTLALFHYFSLRPSDIVLVNKERNKVIIPTSFDKSADLDFSKTLSLIFSNIKSEQFTPDLNITSFTTLHNSLYSLYQGIVPEIPSKLQPIEKISKIKEKYGIQISHSGSITALSFTKDFSIIATGSLEGRVQLWDVHKNQEICTVKPHKRAVYFLEFSPNSQMLLSGGSDQNLGILVLQRKKCLYKRKAHQQYMNCLAISPDSKYAITGGDDAVVLLWDLINRSLLASLQGHISDVQSSLNVIGCDISSQYNIALTTGSDGYVRIWRLDWKCLEGSVTGISSLVPYNSNTFDEISNLMRLDCRYQVITCVKFLKNCKIFISGGEDGYIRIWDLTMKEQLAELSAHRFGRFSGVKCICVTSDDLTAVSGGFDGCIVFIDMPGQQISSSIELHPPGYNGGVVSMCLTSNDKYLVSSGCDSTLIVTDLHTKSHTRHLNIHSNLTLGVKPIESSKIISFGLDGHAKVWQADNGVIKNTYHGHIGLVTAVLVNHFIGEIVTGAYTGHLKFWKVKNAKMKAEKFAHCGWVSFLDFVLEGKEFISGGSDGVVKVWHSASRTCVREVKCCEQSIIEAKMNRLGGAVMVAGHKRKIYLWQVEGDEVECVEKYSRMVAVKRSFPEFRGFMEYLDY